MQGFEWLWAPETWPQVATLSELRCLLISKKSQSHMPCGVDKNKLTKEKCLAPFLACSMYPENQPQSSLPLMLWREGPRTL